MCLSSIARTSDSGTAPTFSSTICPWKKSDDLPLEKKFHHRQALDAEMRRQFLFGIGVDLGQFEFSFVFFSQLRQHRHDGLAGLAPIRPEIYQHGLVDRFFQHQILEILHADIVNIG